MKSSDGVAQLVERRPRDSLTRSPEFKSWELQFSHGKCAIEEQFIIIIIIIIIIIVILN